MSQVSCSDDGAFTRVKVLDLATAAVMGETELELSCGGSDTPPRVITDPQRSRTIFSVSEHPQLFVFSWGDAAVQPYSVHAAAPATAADDAATVLDMALSPDGSRLVSVGSADGLAWLDPETYAVLGRRETVPHFTLFDQCDCRTVHASVLAWSPNGRYLATTSSSGGVDLRNAETRLRVATLSAPTNVEADYNWSSEHGPALVRFSPDGLRVVALYPGHVVSYDTGLPAEE